MIIKTMNNHNMENNNDKKNGIRQQLDAFLQNAKEKRQEFSGLRRDSKHFIIYGFCEDLIIVKYVQEGSYPMYYVLEKVVLLDGLKKVTEQKLSIKKTKDYASKIENSIINRKGGSNSTSSQTKFYFSIHRGFLNKKQTK
jgi:hypothetical protein